MTITVPLALAILSGISSDSSPLNHPAIPQREAEPQDRDVARFLNALVSFLPTEPQSGQVYAISLAFVGNQEVHVCIAANRRADFLDGDDKAPVKTIQKIWDVLRRLSVASSLERSKSIGDLVEIVFSTHWSKMKARFEKRAFFCEQFFKECIPEGLESKQREFLEAAKDIFIRSQDVFRTELPQEPRKFFGEYYNACLRGSHAISLMKKSVPTMTWLSGLEKILQEKKAEKGKIEEKRRKVMHFDLLHYINKLVSTSLHIVTLVKSVCHPSFAGISKLPPLTVQPIYPELNDSPFIDTPTHADLLSYLEDGYDSVEISEADDDVRSEVLELSCKVIMGKWDKLAQNRHKDLGGKDQIAVQASHCECLLLRHHCTNREINPYSYFGVSKLSCLQCGLLFQAYREYVKTFPWTGLAEYETGGCHAEVVPCHLPGTLGSTGMDEEVESRMLNSVKQVIGTILKRDAADLRKRKLSQSSTASSGDEEIDPYTADNYFHYILEIGAS